MKFCICGAQKSTFPWFAALFSGTTPPSSLFGLLDICNKESWPWLMAWGIKSVVMTKYRRRACFNHEILRRDSKRCNCKRRPVCACRRVAHPFLASLFSKSRSVHTAQVAALAFGVFFVDIDFGILPRCQCARPTWLCRFCQICSCAIRWSRS